MEYQIDDNFLHAEDIPKGHMTLVEEDRLDALTVALEDYPHTPCSGGSAANTIFTVQALGAAAGYACRVSDDSVGNYFLKTMRDSGVAITGVAQSADEKTGRCLVLITPDAERSMNTYLGASTGLDIAALDPAAIRASSYLYIEGYLSSAASSTAVALRAREIAMEAGVKTTLTLSDPSMVEFCRDNLETIIGNGLDHIFCNEEEALDWAKTDRIDIAATELSDAARCLSITLGASGSLVVQGHERHEVPGFPSQVLDTTGAGDIYAGASLYGLVQGMPATTAARLANFSAAALVSKYGARLPATEEYQQLLADFEAT
jgi:sugar/nucleoside kinase (ribokinase family)